MHSATTERQIVDFLSRLAEDLEAIVDELKDRATECADERPKLELVKGGDDA